MLSGHPTPLRQRVERRVARVLTRHGYHVTLLSPEDRLYLARAADPGTPLPSDAESYLVEGNGRLQHLRQTYRQLDLPVTRHTHWSPDQISRWVDLRYFRGESNGIA